MRTNHANLPRFFSMLFTAADIADSVSTCCQPATVSFGKPDDF